MYRTSIQPNLPLLLLVEDDINFRGVVYNALKKQFQIKTAVHFEEADELISKFSFDLVILDKFLPNEKTSIPLIQKIKITSPKAPIILLTSDSSFSSFNEAIQLKVSDYLVKPNFDGLSNSEVQEHINQIQFRIHKARSDISILNQNELLQQQVDLIGHVQLVGTSLNFLNRRIQNNCKTNDLPVLILGENGTGKTLVSNLIVRARNNRRPIQELNCNKISSIEIESKLFGYKKNSFPEIFSETEGLIFKANGGDLIINEVSDIPITVQAELLKAIQNQSYCRSGSTAPTKTIFRIICTSRKDLKKLSKVGSFNSDLFKLISSTTLELPPLRERKEDIGDLSQYFLLEIAGVKYSYTENAETYLKSLKYKGNIRELKQRVELAYVNAKNRNCFELDVEDFELSPVLKRLFPNSISEVNSNRYQQALCWTDENFLKKSLDLLNWNLTKTYRALGISRASLYNRMREHRLSQTS